VAKPELGTKRLCAGCGAKFYDLGKTPIVCPKCNTVYEVAPPPRGRSDARAAAAPEPEEAVETPEIETVSLEEADAEATGGKVVAPESEDDIEVDETLVDDDDDDSTFIPEEEEGEDDVTDIIGDRPGDDET
jgi:uncharacterized protein (TIGR02300 family)